MRISIILLFACFPGCLLAQGGWTKITNSAHPIVAFTSPGFYKGAAWVDVNNDGKVDLFAAPNKLFINQGSGNFTLSADTVILPSPAQNPGGCSWGDIDNDGDLDFILAQNPSGLYLNDGTGQFSNATSSLPAFGLYAAWGCAMADLNNDGKLDPLFVHANGFHGSAPTRPCNLYLQGNTPLTFSQVTGYDFTTLLNPYTVPYFADYDMDGDMDLFIATGPGGSPGPDFHYQNLKMETGNDTLSRMTTQPWASQNQDGQCYNFIDYDNDGDLDLCLTNYAGANTRFFQNNSGTYSAVSAPFTLAGNDLTNGWGDFDNDGDLDLIITRDNAPSSYYRNTGGIFTEITNGLAPPAGASGISSGDYDNDGDLDVFVHGSNTAKALYRNDSVAMGNNWVNLNLVGTVSNRSAIGAFVRLKATISGVAVWQLRHLTAQNTFQGHDDLRVHFGLGDASQIDSLYIYWPSGLRETFQVERNTFHTLTEGDGMPIGITEPQNPGWEIDLFPNPATQTLNLQTRERLAGTISIHDLDGKTLLSLPYSGFSAEISTAEFPTGIYLLSLETEHGLITKRWVRK